MPVKIFIGIVIGLFISNYAKEQSLKIMPMGNSITYDDNVADKTNPRDTNDRISYRFRLYQLIQNAGYDFDFVGSENSGNNYFMNEEYDDNAGFPGINDAQMAYLINTGYNQRAKRYEAPGPYLLYYPADVILLHIGTNDLDSSAADVKDILDHIRSFDKNVIVMVARIINRDPYSALTTNFNNHVEAMVKSRRDKKIIMVDMENGAGINYSTDMADYLHPNSRGYNKMAAKWFEALDQLNSAPVISHIPDQNTIQGNGFNQISLDQYISDKEDPDNFIEWTCLSCSGSELNIEVKNRILQVSVKDNKWYGTENVVLKALDSGSGSFRKSDSVSVVYHVEKVNIAPDIISEPPTRINEDSNYVYQIEAVDLNDDHLFFTIVSKPLWLSFNPNTHQLKGIPDNGDVGFSNVLIMVSDGETTTRQEYLLEVVNTNDAPFFDSYPDTTIIAGNEYKYAIHASDIDATDILTYTVVSKPQWMDFTTSDDSASLTGVPSNSDAGRNTVNIGVSDGHIIIYQQYPINVIFQTPIDNNTIEDIAVFYNPSDNKIHITTGYLSRVRFILFDIHGRVLKNIRADHTDHLEIDISELSKSVYVYNAFIDNRFIKGKLIITK